MKIALYVCLACVWVMPLTAITRLKYPSNTPVLQTSEVTIEALGALPEFKVQETSRQAIKAVLLIPADQTDKSYEIPPFDLTFTFKSYVVHLDVNHNQETIDSDVPELLPYYLQSYKLAEVPLKIQIHQGQINFNELPVFKEMQLESFFNEWMQPLFALAGKELRVGDTYHIPFHVNNRESTLQYKIQAITDQEVLAQFHGKLSHKTPPLLDGRRLIMTGTSQGKVAWNRKNALMCNLEAKYLINSELTDGKDSWVLNFNLTHQLVSTHAL